MGYYEKNYERGKDMLNKKAYTEAFFIINEMSEEMRSKIPNKIIKNIENKMDKTYEFYIDEEDIESAELLEDTEKILSVLYTDYLSTPEEREIILNKERILSKQKNESSTHNIKINNPFDEKKETKEKIKESNITELPKEKWYTKIFKFLKNIFD